MTIADRFVDTYCIVENPRRCFLQLPGLANHPHMRNEPEKYLFQEHVKHDRIFNYEGFIPAVQTRYRFINAIRRCEDNAARMFILLNQNFREDAIKILFPEIWTEWHNVMARKAATTELNNRNRIRKRIPRSERLMHRQCEYLTQHMSKNEAARSSRVFT